MRGLLGAFALAVAASTAFAAETVGVADMVAEGARPLSLTLWYPAAAGGTPVRRGGNAVFLGAEGALDADPGGVSLPVLLVSHGGLRSAQDSGAWLAARIAAAGYLVVEVNEPRLGDAGNAPDEIWRRSDDLSRALDAVLADPEWSRRADAQRVAAAGFFLGGTAALAIAGAKLDAEAFVGSCDGGQSAPDCGWLAANGVSLATVDREALARPSRDSRIGAAIAVNPEYQDALVADDPVGLPVLVLGLGSGGARVTGGGEVTHRAFPDASVFDAFDLCTADGAAILQAEGGDGRPCEAAPQARGAVHSAIAEAILSFLKRERIGPGVIACEGVLWLPARRESELIRRDQDLTLAVAHLARFERATSASEGIMAAPQLVVVQ